MEKKTIDEIRSRVAETEPERRQVALRSRLHHCAQTSPRVSNSFFLDQTFYSQWSTYSDRGHLTRRSDPTWGTPDEAERANADTFHFSNCSPQHFRFNESAVYWQGLERYVLENGVLDNETKRRLCVIQGPVFDNKIDLWADDVQIPSSFFKIVVWKSAAGTKAGKRGLISAL
ncbi:DNA/RNA non-specific endonuclease [Paraburkholderia atlantica]|uniref:DNA/RNA non-specific endonuclease n=1 Tax=Paraburkholderia atlantica TaxID=2654982 RepID=UPI00158FDE5A|nr:DNA/RNA non-specific endonuclease [Paraburkholderia atlantica]NUY30716.1 hypothetical protein [Paraburkholderia atlantica]